MHLCPRAHDTRVRVYKLTLVASFQLGEFLRFSEGEISERGRGIALDIFGGELLLERRRGCTYGC